MNIIETCKLGSYLYVLIASDKNIYKSSYCWPWDRCINQWRRVHWTLFPPAYPIFTEWDIRTYRIWEKNKVFLFRLYRNNIKTSCQWYTCIWSCSYMYKYLSFRLYINMHNWQQTYAFITISISILVGEDRLECASARRITTVGTLRWVSCTDLYTYIF